MGISHKLILNLEKEHGDSRVVAFRKRRRFRTRYERQGFNVAYDKDSGVISNIIRTIRHEIYRFEQCAEYGLNESEKMQYFYNFIRNQLPARYNFLNTCGHEISAIIF